MFLGFGSNASTHYMVDLGVEPVPLLSLVPAMSLGVRGIPWQIVYSLALSIALV